METATSLELSYACCPLVSNFTYPQLPSLQWLATHNSAGSILSCLSSSERAQKLIGVLSSFTQNNVSHLVFTISVDLLALL